MENVLIKINEIFLSESISTTKFVIAKFILNHSKFVIENDTISIAKKCNVSAATIIRFCKYLNLTGINELKYHLKMKKPLIPTLQKNNDEYNHYVSIINNGIKKLIDNYVLNRNKLIDLFTGNYKIYIFCFNIAFTATKNFVYRCRAKNYRIFLENDISIIEWCIAHLEENDKVIFISLSGQNWQLNNFAKKINKNNCYAILGNNTSFINDVSDFFILENDENKLWNLFSIRSQLLQQLLDFIFLEL